jgi:Ca2+-binding RTX toxin-like protein
LRLSSQASAAEVLEDRTLLSVTSLFFNGDLTVVSDADDAIVIREDQVQPGRVEILVGTSVGGTIIYSPDTSVGALDANTVQTILVRGGDADNTIDLGDAQGLGGVDTLVFTSLTSVLIEGGNGNDTITSTINFTDVIDAGHGDDVVTLGTAASTVDGGDGNDTITGGPASDVINGGDGNDVISGWAGADTIDAGDGHDVVDGGDELAGPGDSIIGGQGHDTLRGGGGDDWLNGKSGDDDMFGGAGSDVLHGGSGSDVMQGGADDDTINGHGYDDTILGNGGNDKLNGHWGHDFIDGDDDTASATAGDDTLLGGAGRDTLLGNFGDDNLKGQGGKDTLIGGHGLDKLNGGGSHDLLRGFQQQIVHLDFDSQTDPLTEHVYTAAERSAIQSSLASDFAAFGIEFTESAPNTAELYLQNGAYVTVTFNMAPLGVGPSLGGAAEASDYDFRNVDLGGSVSVDVLGPNGLLDGTGQPTSTSNNIVAASAYATAHELGHLLGLRSVDAFGPISGTVGILDPPGAASFSPAFPGPMNAVETSDHLMASGVLLGSANFDVTADLFLSERSAIKLAFNETGLFVSEQLAAHGALTPIGSQPISLRALSVPNTLDSGANSDRNLNVEAAGIVGGTLAAAGEADVYSFQGTGGQVVSIEVLSSWLTRIDTPIDTLVRVFDSTGTILPYHATDIAINDGFNDGSGQPAIDPVLLNLTLPTTGNPSDTYYIEVSEPDPNGVFILPTDGSNQIVELDTVTGGELNRFDLPAGETNSGRAALAFDAVGQRLFFMNGASRILYEIDANDGSVNDQDLITSPIVSSPQSYDGLSYSGGMVYILDVDAETIPGQAEDQNADPPLLQIVDPPEILVFDVSLDVLVQLQFLNLVGTGEGVPSPGANLAGTFTDITGGLAMIDPSGPNPQLLLLDSAGAVVHEIDPVSGVSTVSYTPVSGMTLNMNAVGAYDGQVWLGGAPGEDRIEIFDRADVAIDRTLNLTPNPPPTYGVTAIGSDGDSVSVNGTGGYELFVTKVDFSPLFSSGSLGDTLLGGSGNDTMWGGSANDVLKGGSGADTGSGLGGDDYINAGSGNDTMRGGLDNDSLLGGSGSDRLYGDAGDDTLDGQGASDTLDGNSGDDLLRWRIGNGSDVMNNSADSARFEALGSSAADSLSVSKTSGNRPKLTVVDGINTVQVSSTIWRTDILGGDGNDQLVVGSLENVPSTLLVVNGEAGADTISASGVRIDEVRLRLDGGDDDDTITGSLDADTILGSLGDDRVDGSRGNDTIAGGDGDDSLDGGDDDDVVSGNDGNDTLDGGDGHDSLSGNAGFDVLTGGFGRDTLSGGSEDDALTGSQDDDSLMGDAGQDSLYGGTGNDYLHGGLNDDRLYGNYGDDTIGGGDGDDLLEASQGDDILNGGDGDDTINGGDGFDGISGHDGDDVINGGGDDDTILGGNGHDALSGGGGRDIVLGGDGNDTLNGQGAADTLAGNQGSDVINGFASEINENFTFYESWVDSV